MSDVVLDITISLDGYATGPGQDLTRLHDWIFEGGTPVDAEVGAEFAGEPGAYVMGMGMFRSGEKPWGPEPPFPWPVFVVTHAVREPLVKPPATFTFVNDGVGSAVEQAKEAAKDRDVWVVGGADVARQCLRLGLLDVLRIHVAHVLLGDGDRLFDRLPEAVELEPVRTISSPGVTHLTFRAAQAPRR